MDVSEMHALRKRIIAAIIECPAERTSTSDIAYVMGDILGSMIEFNLEKTPKKDSLKAHAVGLDHGYSVARRFGPSTRCTGAVQRTRQDLRDFLERNSLNEH